MSGMEIFLIASAAMGALGSIQQGNAQAANYQAQAAAERRNADIDRLNAQATAQQAAQAEDAQRRKARQIGGMQRAALAQNATGDGGTNALVIQQSATDAEMDALNMRYEGEMRRRGLLNDAAGKDYNARILKKNASQARTAGFIGAGTSLLKGGADYYGAQKALV